MIAPVLRVALAEPSSAARQLSARAKKLFKQKNLKGACSLWERAAGLAPDDAAAWTTPLSHASSARTNSGVQRAFLLNPR